MDNEKPKILTRTDFLSVRSMDSYFRAAFAFVRKPTLASTSTVMECWYYSSFLKAHLSKS